VSRLLSLLFGHMEVISMYMRLFAVNLVLSYTLAATGHAFAGDPPKPDLKPLLAEVKKLVAKYYPKAKVSLKDQTIHFEFNTREFQIHDPGLIGEWQDAHEEIGPQKGGIYGIIAIHPARYMEMAAMPRLIDKRYYISWETAPYSKKIDHHLRIWVNYPRNVPKGFLKEFEGLVDGFGKHVPVEGK